jgi:hypothetical protein
MEQSDDLADTNFAMTGTGGYFSRVGQWFRESF